jgi:hypothetical protein
MRQAALSNIETGKNGISEANIRLICVTYNVNETWLRTGEGPMFGNDLPGAPDERELVSLFRRLTPAIQRVVLHTVQELLEAQGERE